MSVPSDDKLVRLGIIAYFCETCNAFQLFGGSFEPDNGILAPTICPVIRGSEGFICGGKVVKTNTRRVLDMLLNIQNISGVDV